jgi:hypothetical protein
MGDWGWVVLGKKTFFVVPPEAAGELEPSTIPQYANTSTIPVPVSRVFSNSQALDTTDDDLPPDTLERCRAQLRIVFALPGACQVELEAGDSVLVPQGWWHSAEGVDGPGVGVGAWFR